MLFIRTELDFQEQVTGFTTTGTRAALSGQPDFLSLLYALGNFTL
jgi:hypothetical protein